MAGIGVTKDQVNAVAGQLALDLADVSERVKAFKSYLDQTSDNALEALGFTAGEVALIKSAYADAAELVSVMRGEATVAVAKDFRAFLRQLWGMGRK